MSWGIHWQVTFAGYDGGQYRANIMEQNYTGSVVQLTGAAHPFVTQEDATEDVFTPIRGQTGYLRIVTADLSVMEQIMPATNTEKMVELRYGANDTLMWRGFLQAQAFTQPWDNNARQLEFPLKSVLSALEDVQMDDAVSSERGMLWPILVSAMEALNVEPEQVVMATAESTIGSMMQHLVKYELFFSSEDIDNEGITTTEQISNSYYDVLASIATLHGVVFREKGANIYIMDYLSQPLATAGTLRIATFAWSSITGGTYTSTASQVSASDMLTAINNTKRGIDNVIGYINGRKSVRVRIDLDQNGESIISLPTTTEDASTVLQKAVNGGGDIVYMQVHSPRISSYETYYFSQYDSSGVRQGASTYARCLGKSSIYYTEGQEEWPAYTGAYPCRWYYKSADDYSQVILKNGLYLTLINGRQSQYTDGGRCYQLTSRYTQRLTGGYLNLNLIMHYFGALRWNNYGDVQVTINVVVRFGGYSWDGTAWVAESEGIKQFAITIKDNTIVTNKTADMNVDADTGYFIPVGEEKYGSPEVYIMDYYSGLYATITPMGFVLESLTLGYYYSSNLSASDRGSNTYYRSLLSSGFGQERVITTNIGTWNNNTPSLSFLYDANVNYVQTMSYKSSGSTVNIRPELHLLGLMATYCATVRRTMTQVMKLADIYDRLYSYNGKYYEAIDESHDWRDEKQRVKFIEVK